MKFNNKQKPTKQTKKPKNQKTLKIAVSNTIKDNQIQIKSGAIKIPVKNDLFRVKDASKYFNDSGTVKIKSVNKRKNLESPNVEILNIDVNPGAIQIPVMDEKYKVKDASIYINETGRVKIKTVEKKEYVESPKNQIDINDFDLNSNPILPLDMFENIQPITNSSAIKIPVVDEKFKVKDATKYFDKTGRVKIKTVEKKEIVESPTN